MRRLRRMTAVAALVAASVPVTAAETLEPYQLVRSLQLVQDRIAAGDHAALPMQRKLLEMTDARLRRAIAPDFEDRRNFEAMLVYAMSGGNPITVDAVLSRLTLGDVDRTLGRGLRAYLRGDLGEAMIVLDQVDPRGMATEVGAFVALVKGSVIAGEDPRTALQMFDWARLLGPGTLVEEAALRRSMPASARLGDGKRFLFAVDAYVRRFLRSPYATQFADELVAGIIKLARVLDFESIEKSVGEMSAEHQRVIYLRLARTGAIEGLQALSDFASRKSSEFEESPDGAPDARAMLYSSLSSVTSDDADTVLAKLRSIDRRKLSAPDRKLLDAAVSIAATVTRRPDPIMEVSAPEPLRPLVSTPDGIRPALTREAAADADEAEAGDRAAQPIPSPSSMSGRGEAEQPNPIVSETRRRLAEIDKLLETQ